jgi:hypothetical protein
MRSRRAGLEPLNYQEHSDRDSASPQKMRTGDKERREGDEQGQQSKAPLPSIFSFAVKRELSEEVKRRAAASPYGAKPNRRQRYARRGQC